MWRVSHFHELIASSREELQEEFMKTKNSEFCKKYNIGWRTLNYYFGWIKKNLYKGDQIWRQDVRDTLENIRTWNYHYNLY